MTGRGSGAERGGVGLLMLLAGMLVTAAGIALVVAATDLAVAAARARTAADAAALAAAGSSPLAWGDGDPHAAADRIATANGAQVVACCGSAPGAASPAAAPVVVVEVAVRPRLVPLAALRARAAATLRPEEQPERARRHAPDRVTLAVRPHPARTRGRYLGVRRVSDRVAPPRGGRATVGPGPHRSSQWKALPR